MSDDTPTTRRSIDSDELKALTQRLAADFADLASDETQLREYQRIAAIFDGTPDRTDDEHSSRS
jgi:hypothetical protein